MAAQYHALEGYVFRKIPKFGWFAHNPGTGIVTNLVEIMDTGKNAGQAIYRKFTKETQFQENKMIYSESVESKFIANFDLYRKIRHAYGVCVEEANTNGKVRWKNGEMVGFNRIMEEYGLTKLVENGRCGIITERAAKERYEGRPLDFAPHMLNKILVPTFYTPSHVASLSYTSAAEFTSVNQHHEFYCPIETGWYGSINDTVVPSFSALLIDRGCTWDKKVDLWSTEITKLHKELSVKQLIDIWKDAKQIKLKDSPLELIKDRKGIEHIKENLTGLSFAQVSELEKLTGEKLTEYWEIQSQKELEVSGVKFRQQHSRYYIIRNHNEYEYTNFAVKLTKIIKKNGEFLQQGFIIYNNTETPFECKRSAFSGYHNIMEELTNIFLESGIGVPVVSPTHKHYLTNVIYAFNPDIPIEKS